MSQDPQPSSTFPDSDHEARIPRPGQRPMTESQPALLLELMREMRGQRDAYERANEAAAAERKAEHRWRMLFQSLVFGVPVVFAVVYFLFFLNTTGFRWGPFGDSVGVIRIEGTIGSSERSSADNIVPVLNKAFSNPSVKAVVLSIDSPGGAPVEAERIYSAIGALKRKHPKPVVAVINNVGASAAFMIALHADKIVAARYSLVGSIGAIMAPWQLDRAIAKFDVAQRVYASGKLKSFLNPFVAVSPEVDAKAHKIVDTMGAFFLDEVKSRRGDRLKTGVDVGTGEVWSGPEAKDLGLIDEVGTLDEFVKTNWALPSYDFGPSPQGIHFITNVFQDAIIGAIQRLTTSVPVIR
jgi:protease IV